MTEVKKFARWSFHQSWKLSIFHRDSSICCVFWPAFGCCTHLKAEIVEKTLFVSRFRFLGVFWPAFRSTQHLKAGWNTQHPSFYAKSPAKLFHPKSFTKAQLSVTFKHGRIGIFSLNYWVKKKITETLIYKFHRWPLMLNLFCCKNCETLGK